MSKPERFRKVARKLLKFSNHSRYNMACVLLRGSNIISFGVNKETSPKKYVRSEFKIGHHCEIDAINGMAKNKTKGCTLIIVGETVVGTQILTKPCPSCYTALCAAGIKKVYYETREGKLEKLVI